MLLLCHDQYGGQVAYLGLSTASDVVLIVTTQLHSLLCTYNCCVHTLTSRECFEINTPILLSPGG